MFSILLLLKGSNSYLFSRLPIHSRSESPIPAVYAVVVRHIKKISRIINLDLEELQRAARSLVPGAQLTLRENS